jgi:hypothetical protein
MNRSRSQRLSGNERGSGLPRDGEKMGRRRRKLRPLTSFMCVSDDTPTANRSGGDTAW